MKTIFLIRHSEAEQESPYIKDYDRELTPRGFSMASLLGKDLQAQGFFPDIFLTSQAVRAYTTAQFIAEQLQFDTDRLQASKELYNASVQKLLTAIHEIPDTVQKAIFVNHNMSLTFLLEYLTAKPFMLPPCGAVLLEFDVESWKEVNQAKGKVLWQKL